MSETARVTATFAGFEPFVAAVKGLRAAGLEQFDTYSPVPLPESAAPVPRRGSPIRWYALAAGIAGCVGGFALCIIASRYFGLIVSGKPVASWIPFCVIAFEVTVLTAGVVTMASVFLHSRLYPREIPSASDASFSVDAFGISVPCTDDGRAAVIGLLREAGADDVREEPTG